jgi:hypothetical protein
MGPFRLLPSYKTFRTAVNKYKRTIIPVNRPIFLSDFDQIWMFLARFTKIFRYQIS